MPDDSEAPDAPLEREFAEDDALVERGRVGPTGFACLPPEERVRMAAVGGRASREQGNVGTPFDSERGRKAGMKGGAKAAEFGKIPRFTSEQARAASLKSWEARRARQRVGDLPSSGDERDQNTDALDGDGEA